MLSLLYQLKIIPPASHNVFMRYKARKLCPAI